MGKHLEAAKIYEQYTVMYPTGERIDSAHLNIIDSYREAGRYREANDWIAKTRNRFTTTPTETNALQAKLRMEIHRGIWNEAAGTADIILALNKFTGSMATIDEIRYLKAYALEKAGKKKEAADAYNAVPNSIASYWGGLASEGLKRVDPQLVRATASVTPQLYQTYPTPFAELVLANARKHRLDPRFLLAIMRQESSFQPRAKSPAAARGLLQLVFDTALKYNREAGYPNLVADDLYDPATNIAIGSAYIAALRKEFGGLYEGIAASYNAGEDNTVRWLNRTNPKDPGIFTAEVGFAETKNYVYKVMGNYRAYVALYDENLSRR
jgi:soluble lytic murein transglycosylase-like protein